MQSKFRVLLGLSHGNGLYWIDPNGGSTHDSFQAFCDMDTEGGGWTLVATKVSPSFVFIKTAFSTLAAKTKTKRRCCESYPSWLGGLGRSYVPVCSRQYHPGYLQQESRRATKREDSVRKFLNGERYFGQHESIWILQVQSSGSK